MAENSESNAGHLPASFPQQTAAELQAAQTDNSLPLILASASPRRQELIALLGMPFRIMPSRYVEPPPPQVPVSLPELVMELAKQKALEVAARAEPGWVLGADTLVSLEAGVGLPLGKPTDREDARRMLHLLSGRIHFVYTGIALCRRQVLLFSVRPSAWQSKPKFVSEN